MNQQRNDNTGVTSNDTEAEAALADPSSGKYTKCTQSRGSDRSPPRSTICCSTGFVGNEGSDSGRLRNGHMGRVSQTAPPTDGRRGAR